MIGTEKQIIDDLGEWLCRDMEKDVQISNENHGLPPTHQMENQVMIRHVAKRIQFYRDNCIKS